MCCSHQCMSTRTNAWTHIHCSDRCQSIVLTSAATESMVSLLLLFLGVLSPPSALCSGARKEVQQSTHDHSLLQTSAVSITAVICIICVALHRLECFIHPLWDWVGLLHCTKHGSESSCKAPNEAKYPVVLGEGQQSKEWSKCLPTEAYLVSPCIK